MLRTIALFSFATVTFVACTDPGDVAAPIVPGSLSLAKSTVEDPTATFRLPLPGSGLSVTGDGAFSDGASSVYANGVCGIEAKLFATQALSNSGDATMGSGPRSKDRTCAAYPRRIRVMFPDGLTELTPTFTNARQIQNTTSIIPIGVTVKRALHMGLAESTRCEGLAWNAERQGVLTGADSVLVTRLAPDQWRVQSQPGNAKAFCVPNGPLYDMTVDFTITSSRPLPLPLP